MAPGQNLVLATSEGPPSRLGATQVEALLQFLNSETPKAPEVVVFSRILGPEVEGD